jgi:pimeloyl-ACP methyl ester carboxylesterase
MSNIPRVFWPATAVLAVLAALAIAAFFLSWQTPEREQVGVRERQPRVEWQSCDPMLYSTVPTRCGRYFPEGDSGRFFLPFAIFEGPSQAGGSTPLVYIAGGPGDGMQTGGERLQSWAYWLEEAQLQRDFIVYDQRGLKPGQPYWDCLAYNQLSVELLAFDASVAEENERTSDVLQSCFVEFDHWLKNTAGVPQGMRSFNSVRAATELNGMLAALGYDQWNLWGVSYGSRLALVAAQQAPDRVRSLLLDSPYPLDVGQASLKPQLYAAALQRFWTICTRNQAFCGVSVDDPEALFWRVFQKLETAPRHYQVRTPGSSLTVPFVLNGQRLFTLAMFALYDHRFYSELLQGLVSLDQSEDRHPNEGVTGSDSVQFLLNSLVVSALDEDFNSLIFFAIECNDNPLESADVVREAARAHPLIGDITEAGIVSNPCAAEVFEADDLLAASAPPAAPTLILAGELDPVTPPEWGQRLVDQLPKSRLIVVPEVGHAVLSSGACDPTMLEDFLASPIENLAEAGRSCF